MISFVVKKVTSLILFIVIAVAATIFICYNNNSEIKINYDNGGDDVNIYSYEQISPAKTQLQFFNKKLTFNTDYIENVQSRCIDTVKTFNSYYHGFARAITSKPLE